MTFLAQPYEQFADDLLTALTGGMIREEHRFIGIEEQYSLGVPDVIPRTIKIVGHSNSTIAVFEGGIDYLYDAGEGVITWQPQGRWPDDHTYFYVNYYLQEGRRRLTDRNPGSVTTTLAEAFAREFAVLHKQMEMIYQSAFVDSATGGSLDHVAALLALARKDAKFAGGEALFKRTTPADGDITIPAGTIISTDRQNFETSDKRTLRKGQLSVVVPIRAQEAGTAGRVAAGLINNINRPIFGIESVTNEAPTFFATEKETDEELRRRIKGTLERAGKSTVNSIKFSLIEDVPGINEGNVQVTENAEVPGQVEVKFGLGGNVDPDLVRRIEETIFNSRAAGVRVTHNLPSRSTEREREGMGITRPEVMQHFSGRGEPVPLVHLAPDVLSQMPEGIVELQIEILLRLTEPNLSAAQKERIEDGIRTAVIDYVESLPMGADLIYAKVLGRIIASNDVGDALLLIRLLGGSGASEEIFKQNLATDGRKAVVRLESIVVELMQEAIFIDVLVQLEPKPPVEETPKVTAELKSAIAMAIQDTFEGTEGKLSSAALRTAIGGATTNTFLQFTPDRAVVLNAEYEETGRLLYDAEEVTVAANQLLRLRSFEVTIPGALDG